MWWNKRIISIEDIERTMELETRTQNLKSRISELNRKIGRDPTKPTVISEPKEEIKPPLDPKKDEMDQLRAKLLGKKISDSTRF